MLKKSKMIRLVFLALSVASILAYTIPYDDKVDDCKKDLWILWDNSQSVGKKTFLNKVEPFLKKLIQSPQLNVGPDGTHIGILTFSTEAQTRVLLDMGEKKTQQSLVEYLGSLTYEELKGDGTRTGMAFKMASDKMPEDSPANYRPHVSDMVMLVTDGEPRRHRGENTFGDKYKSNTKGEILLANDQAAALRSRGITIVGLAVGTMRQLERFKGYIKSWSSDDMYFEAREDALQNVADKLVDSSCSEPSKNTEPQQNSLS